MILLVSNCFLCVLICACNIFLDYLLLVLGGLNLKSLTLQQHALQLKFIKHFTDPTINESWVILPRYWLGHHLAQLHPDWAFIANDNTCLQLPMDVGNHRSAKNKSLKISRPEYFDMLIQQINTLDLTKIQWITLEIYATFIKNDYKTPTA